MKNLLYPILLLLYSTGLSGQANISLSTARTTGGTETACQSITLKPGFKFTATSTASLTLTVNPTTCDPYAGQASSASSNQNYIQTRTYTTDDGSRYMEAIQYFDGLGRPVQTVQRGITPNTADLVTYQEYDAFGRESNAWLPAVISGNNGAFVTPATVKTAAVSSNGNDQKPYSMPVYEASPLNRVMEQYGPGQDWHNNSKKVSTAYKTNISGDATLNCKLYIAGGTNQNPTLSQTTNYATGQLYVTEIKDEDGNTSYEFKDKLGQVVLTRQINDGQNYDTYYVYNDFGKQCFVLPPKIQDEGIAAAKLNELAYQYKYDHRNRCIAKKIPGCDWIYYVYDKADRLIFTQDGEQRKTNEWTFQKYDAFGRVIMTGLHIMAGKTHDQLRAIVENEVVTEQYTLNSHWSYSWNSLTALLTSANYKQILQVNYYDNYNFRNRPEYINTQLSFVNKGTEYNKRYGTDAGITEAKGQLTGTAIARLDGQNKFDYGVLYYDSRGRLIQTRATNHLGGIEEDYIAYNFTGQPTKKMHIHSATGKNAQTEVYAYTYDHAGRLLKTTHQLTDGTTVKPQVTLAENTYDELGRLKTNKKGGQANLTSTYAYNVRSWMKSITSPLFTETLYYNESYGGSVKQYNGNISAMSWKQLTEPLRYYAYSYDNLSRLTNANYGEDNSATNRFTTSYSYDKHGNMKTLTRRGNTDGSATNGMVDNLTMTYTGNQLAKVSDTGVSVPMSSSMDFKDYSNVATEYTYNANGAMNKDLNKGISDIQYNSLNLPRMMDIKSPVAEARNEYTYSASGQKLKVVQKWNPNYSTAPVIGSGINTAALTMTKTTDYVENIIYENGNLKRILVDGGYYEGGVYYYYLADHLGNNHVVVKSDGTSIQSNSYYPFGMHYAPGIGYEKQPYKYNNKELDQMHGLNMYDYSARYLALDVPRFTTVDPHAEKYYSISPYVYCVNNPINVIDPNGMDTINISYNGNISVLKGGDRDILNTIDEKGNITSNSYDKGTIKHQTVTVNYKNEDGSDGSWTYEKLAVNGSNNATSVFNAIADISKVEWSHGTFLNIKGGKNIFLTDYLTTSKQRTSEGGIRQLWMEQAVKGNVMIGHTHNHPDLPGTYQYQPSGLPVDGTGDIQFAKDINSQQKIPSSFFIKVPGVRNLIPYSPTSVPSDFPKFGHLRF